MITEEARRRTVAALHRLDTDGGFPNVAGRPPTLGGTLSVVKALGLLGDRPRDPDAVHAFVTRHVDVTTGAWRDPVTGAPSVLATAAGLLCLRSLDATASVDRWLGAGLRAMTDRSVTREEHFMTVAVVDEFGLDVPLPRSVSFFQDLETDDGTFGPDPLQNAIAASALLRAGAALRSPEAVTGLLLRSQGAEGGFADDLWTSYCVMRALDLLGAAPDTGTLARWVLASQRTDGGFGDPGPLSTGATYQCLSVLDWIASPVLATAREGDEAALGRYLAAGGDPDVRDLRGWTALCTAAVRGRSGAVRALLAAGADPDLRVPEADALPIFWAGQSGDLDTVRSLLGSRPAHLFEISSVNGHTVLLQAVFFGTERHRDVVAWLIDHVGDVLGLGSGGSDGSEGSDGMATARRRLLAACNVRGYTATTMAALWHNEELSALLATVDDTTAEERDAYYGRLLASIAGPPPDDPAAQRATDDLIARIGDGFDTLNAAAAGHGDLDAARSRLTADVTAAVAAPGFDINRRGGPLAQTPVIAAVTGVDADERVGRARLALVSLLLRHGADPDLPELHPMGVDAVIRAAVLNHFACLQEISRFMGPLAFAAALNERPAINGQTALDDTVHRALTASDESLPSHLEQIRWAVARGARTDIADLTGVTVEDRARLAVGDAALGRNAAAVLDALGVPAPPRLAPPTPATSGRR